MISTTRVTKTYTLKGLGCASCAAKIERAVQVLEGVSGASINLINSKLQVETDENHTESITGHIEKIVHKYEPDVVVILHEKKEHEHEEHEHKDCCGHEHMHESNDEHGDCCGHEHETHEYEHKHSDGCCDHDHSHIARNRAHEPSGDKEGKKQITVILIGGLIFAAGLILQNVFVLEEYVRFIIYLTAYIILGGRIVLRAAKNITRGQVFDENFLMSIATIGAFIIREFPEAVAVMLFYQIGMYFQDLAVRRSKKSITDLMDIRPDYANLKMNGDIITVAPESVKIGDIIIVKPGEKIPLDGVVIDGSSMLDTRALTGESVPRSAKQSDTVLSGCINLNGVLTIEVTKIFGESTVAKIIDLVENAGAKKALTEKFITKFARYYTPGVVILAALIAVIPALFMGHAWYESVYRGLVVLVISCPCALVISIPLGFFGGIGGASKRGILVKGGNYLEALNDLEIVVFDKTGTLTKGVFEVTSIQPTNGFTKNEILKYAASAEVFSNHPIAVSILKAYGDEVKKDSLSEYNDIAGYGVSVNSDGKIILAGNYKLMNLKGIKCEEADEIGSKVYIAVDNVYAGYIIISDEIKPDSYKAIAALKENGVRKTVMLSGDNPQIAEAIAKELNLDEVYAGLLPGQKVEMVEKLNNQKRPKGKLAFIGDGINDAPVLARSDIGIAMGGLGSDAAIEAADVVLMTDEPSKLIEAIEVARFTKRVVWQNIVISLAVKGVFIVLGTFDIASMWEAVFADVGVALLAILNASRVIRMK